ncbi:MAG: hypothetical protein VX860_00795 [Verrucomicrobiota bacterium]|nr:hypothetical protein [Verrucomicrobiota bacterium]
MPLLRSKILSLSVTMEMVVIDLSDSAMADFASALVRKPQLVD